MSDPERRPESINDPDVREEDPEYGPRPIRSPLQATVRVVLGLVSLAVLIGLVWVLLR